MCFAIESERLVNPEVQICLYTNVSAVTGYTLRIHRDILIHKCVRNILVIDPNSLDGKLISPYTFN